MKRTLPYSILNVPLAGRDPKKLSRASLENDFQTARPFASYPMTQHVFLKRNDNDNRPRKSVERHFRIVGRAPERTKMTMCNGKTNILTDQPYDRRKMFTFNDLK